VFADDRLFHVIRQSFTKAIGILRRCPGGTEEMLMVVD
jgi:hypothetical protein